MTAIQTATQGIMSAQQQFERSVERMHSSRPGADLTVEIVEQVSAKHMHSANIASLKTADDMQKRLLDVLV
jgi:flagellar hook protein FlgE